MERNDSKTQSNIKNNVTDLCNTKNLQRNGTDQTKAEHGTVNTQRKYTSPVFHLGKHANIVEMNSMTSTEVTKADSAQTNVNRHGDEMLDSTTKNESASIVESPSQKINTQNKRHAPKVVQLNKDGLIAKVYNLKVDDAHEYYANGILVHNCDSIRYAMFTAPTEPVQAVSNVRIERPSFGGFASSRPTF